jgi:Flp pilus assembly protein TadD
MEDGYRRMWGGRYEGREYDPRVPSLSGGSLGPNASSLVEHRAKLNRSIGRGISETLVFASGNLRRFVPLAWVAKYGESRPELNLERDEKGIADRYRRALRLATEANRREPESYAILNTLGVALYRCGRYHEARDTLTKSAEMSQGSAADLAFLAMSQHQLGQKAAARATLTRLPEGISVSADPESQGFLREAQELLGAKASPAQK